MTRIARHLLVVVVLAGSAVDGRRRCAVPVMRAPRASSRCTPRPTRARRGRERAGRRAGRPRSARAGEQVDDVVLAEVHEREAERAARRSSRRRPAPGPPPRAGARPSRMWRSAARAWLRAGCLPGNCRAAASASFQNASPCSTIMRRSAGSPLGPGSPVLRRVPRRRGRHRPVADHAEVEDARRSAPRRRGKRSRWRSSM